MTLVVKGKGSQILHSMNQLTHAPIWIFLFHPWVFHFFPQLADNLCSWWGFECGRWIASRNWKLVIGESDKKTFPRKIVWIEFKVETVNNKLALFFTETYSGLRKKCWGLKAVMGKCKRVQEVLDNSFSYWSYGE